MSNRNDPYGQNNRDDTDGQGGSNPYGEQPAGDAYGQPPADSYGQSSANGHQQPAPYAGQNSPYPGQSSPYAAPGAAVGAPYNKNNALVLIIVGALCGGLLPAIFGVLAYVKADEDPNEARKMQKWGWIAFAIIWAISIILIIVYIVVIAAALNAGAM